MNKPEETKLQTNEPTHVNPGQGSGSDFEDMDFYEKFEFHRRAANNYLRSYFECFTHHHDLPGLNRRSLNPQKDGDSKVSPKTTELRAGATRELAMLQDILQMIQKQEQHPVKSVSSDLAIWTASCLILAYAVPHPAFSIISACFGTVVLTARMIRKYLQLREIVPLQHKVGGLIRGFKNGTIRYRDLDEVLISSLE
ncbi:uncharacterized protein B0J16DRAFT_378844 [Fusarium flagelliforme]|uniref:Uncharacterized protein n=1 Tax=Fusarium flagelliforme TaxID=2675880 RepID=A0A395N4Y0_9HYPO|nr:uncharacterized protein B0J16DRAFT_378844 [Fusarium flagelliforme]KAH7198403.1 hypothetical protein B0J16DRAFT_378844 [Fusarium flagelliforme]RFN55198.1 hypothetical protein FIE12Z_451 [Fusarium flagelliforme]